MLRACFRFGIVICGLVLLYLIYRFESHHEDEV